MIYRARLIIVFISLFVVNNANCQLSSSLILHYSFNGGDATDDVGSQDGTVYVIGMKIAGSTVTVYPPTGPAVSVTDSDIAVVHGQYCVWETAKDDAGGKHEGKIESVWALG